MNKLKLLAPLITVGLTLALPAATFASTLSLGPATGTLNRGCTYPLQVLLNTTGTNTDGTDAIILYDPTKFSADTSSITNGTIYPDYPGNVVDNKTGKITISGLASVSQPYTGSGTLATINIKVLDTAATGATSITFDFDPNNKAKTTDSNVVERGTVADTLNQVTNGNYTIGTGGTCTGTFGNPGQGAIGGPIISTPSATFFPSPTPNLDKIVGGPTGLEGSTVMLAVVGSALTILGIIGLAFL